MSIIQCLKLPLVGIPGEIYFYIRLKNRILLFKNQQIQTILLGFKEFLCLILVLFDSDNLK